MIAGTTINLSWEVQNANKVSLSVDGNSLGDQALMGVLPQRVIDSENYSLLATNGPQNSQKSATALLRIEADVDIPKPPAGFIGTVVASDMIRLTWTYDNNEENKIIGFRVYRSDAPPHSTFRRIADEGDLDPGKEEYTDQKDFPPNCGKSYYVVAVYEDVNGNLQETDSTAN